MYLKTRKIILNFGSHLHQDKALGIFEMIIQQ